MNAEARVQTEDSFLLLHSESLLLCLYRFDHLKQLA
jgi:hypothetical protein